MSLSLPCLPLVKRNDCRHSGKSRRYICITKPCPLNAPSLGRIPPILLFPMSAHHKKKNSACYSRTCPSKYLITRLVHTYVGIFKHTVFHPEFKNTPVAVHADDKQTRNNLVPSRQTHAVTREVSALRPKISSANQQLRKGQKKKLLYCKWQQRRSNGAAKGEVRVRVRSNPRYI